MALEKTNAGEASKSSSINAEGVWCASGCTPLTLSKHEELQVLVRSFYLTLNQLSESETQKDHLDRQSALTILIEMAETHGIMAPQDSVKRSKRAESPEVLSNNDTLNRLGSFMDDFGIGDKYKPRLSELQNIIVDVFDRHGVGKADYVKLEGKQTLVGFKWNPRNMNNTLADVLASEKTLSSEKRTA
jgi:hypothetical protein